MDLHSLLLMMNLALRDVWPEILARDKAITTLVSFCTVVHI